MFINHCHVFPEGSFEGKDAGYGTIPDLLSFMDANRIDRAAVFAPTLHWMPKDTFYKPPIRDGNAWLHEAIAPYRDRLTPVLALNPAEKGACDVLKKYSREGFVGVKVHPCVYDIRIDEPEYDGFYTAAEEEGLFVAFHTGVHGGWLRKYTPLLIDNVANRHPGLKIIIEHMGLPFAFEEALAVLYSHSPVWNNYQVYAGLTGDFPADRVRKIFDLVGSERMVFGMDFPGRGFSGCYSRIRESGMPADDVENVMGGTLQRIIGEATDIHEHGH